MTMLLLSPTTQAQWMYEQPVIGYDFVTPSYAFTLPSFNYYYKPFVEQSDLFSLYTPSEITLNNDFIFFDSGPNHVDDDSDGWQEIPYGDLEQALRVPVENGLWLLMICLLGYALFKKTRIPQNFCA
jgi:hypothetical protein